MTSMATHQISNALPSLLPDVRAPTVLPAAPTTVEVVPVNEKKAMVLPMPTLNVVFSRRGNTLEGTGYLVNGGKIEVIRTSMNLVELGKLLMAEQAQNGDAAHVGDFLGIGAAISSIAKSSLVRSIAKAAKSIVQSKEVGAAIGGLAVVFPPVGLPAAGAYASANIALKYIENGRKAIQHAEKMVKRGKNLTPKDKANLEKAIARKKRAQDKLRKIALRAKKPPNPKLRDMQRAVAKKNAELRRAKSPRRLIPPVSPQEYAKIVSLVFKSRRRQENIKRSLDLPQALNIAPRVVKTPITKNNPIIVFWRRYLREHPDKVRRLPAKRAA